MNEEALNGTLISTRFLFSFVISPRYSLLLLKLFVHFFFLYIKALIIGIIIMNFQKYEVALRIIKIDIFF
jgi:hypothetical protein